MTWLFSILGIGGIGAALFFIPGAIPAVIGAFSALLGLIRRNPWPCAVIALCGACVWLWLGWNHANAQRDTWHRAYDLRVEAEKLATAAQIKLNAERRQEGKEAANAADTNHADETDSNRRAASAWADAHRMRGPTCPAGQGHPTTQDADPAVPANAPGEADPVAVPARDLVTIADNYSYATACHSWAMDLIARGVGE